jgi:hypothetical protein
MAMLMTIAGRLEGPKEILTAGGRNHFIAPSDVSADTHRSKLAFETAQSK